MDLQKILEDQGWRYEGTPTIPPGMTMDQYRQQGNVYEIHAVIRTTDHNRRRAEGWVKRTLKRRNTEVEIIAID